MLGISAWWIGLSAELQAALVGAAATAGAAIFGVGAVIAQVRSQGRQSRAAIAETERRKINAALYEDAVSICRGLADASIELSTKLHTMNMEIEVAARAEAAMLAYNLPSARFPSLSALYGEFTDAALRFIFLIENRRIIDPRILIFRTAMNTVLHDSRQSMFSDFVLHVMPALPTDNPNGGIFPYKPPSIEGALAVRKYSDQLIRAVDDATAYTEDFLTEMQNVLLGDLYGNHLEPRQPLDPARRTVTLDQAQDLETWFSANTAWGVHAGRVEAEARERFQLKQDGAEHGWPRRHVVAVDELPLGFPTHRHSSDFWQALGRAVATFGFLEETLGKAIFSFTAMRSYPDEQIEEAYRGWLKTLEHALSDPLGNLIDSYGKAVCDHSDATIENLDELIADLRAAAVIRNVICHGSWGMPDDAGRSLPLFVNKRIEKFETPIDTPYLDQLQRHTAELACAVINTVTHMGWQFPGSNGPGDPIFRRS